MYLTLPKATQEYLKLLSEKIQDTEEARRAFEEYCMIIKKYSDQIGVTKPDDGIYRETHHILPAYYCKIACNEGIKDRQNLINLPADQHFMCHYWLALATNNTKLILAFNMMSNFKRYKNIDRTIIKSVEYAKLKEMASAELSKMHSGENHYATSLTPSLVTKIRGDIRPAIILTKAYGISYAVLRGIIKRNTWKDLPLVENEAYIVRERTRLGIKLRGAQQRGVSKPGRKGETNGNAILTEDDVMALRSNPAPIQQLSEIYGITYGSAYGVVNRTSWAYLPLVKNEAEIIKMRKLNGLKRRSKLRESSEIKTVTCVHCGKSGPSSIMYRWHFDACKNKPVTC